MGFNKAMVGKGFGKFAWVCSSALVLCVLSGIFVPLGKDFRGSTSCLAAGWARRSIHVWTLYGTCCHKKVVLGFYFPVENPSSEPSVCSGNNGECALNH